MTYAYTCIQLPPSKGSFYMFAQVRDPLIHRATVYVYVCSVSRAIVIDSNYGECAQVCTHQACVECLLLEHVSRMTVTDGFYTLQTPTKGSRMGRNPRAACSIKSIS